tara:strand:- start:292 stop:978 length:687 start_codon:yes stop_codon:yes gene_type:complete
MIVSIHQPNYLPWLGFFNKIKLSDVFVIFDDVQFPRGKKHFGHRNKIKTNNGNIWLTIPLIGKSELKSFNTISINYENDWRKKHLSLIESFYKKTPYYSEYYFDIRDIIKSNYNSLHELNTELILYFLQKLKINTKILLSSDICPPGTSGGDKINFILKELKATDYISGSGPGSKRYIDEENFKQRNINLIWQEYKHPIYNQQYKDFLPYMAIIDLLFNEGPNSKNII